ncbi:hypothetical protein Tco_0037324, partial [Tanacetum coccineum]
MQRIDFGSGSHFQTAIVISFVAKWSAKRGAVRRRTPARHDEVLAKAPRHYTLCSNNWVLKPMLYYHSIIKTHNFKTEDLSRLVALDYESFGGGSRSGVGFLSDMYALCADVWFHAAKRLVLAAEADPTPVKDEVESVVVEYEDFVM